MITELTYLKTQANMQSISATHGQQGLNTMTTENEPILETDNDTNADDASALTDSPINVSLSPASHHRRTHTTPHQSMEEFEEFDTDDNNNDENTEDIGHQSKDNDNLEDEPPVPVPILRNKPRIHPTTRPSPHSNTLSKSSRTDMSILSKTEPITQMKSNQDVDSSSIVTPTKRKIGDRTPHRFKESATKKSTIPRSRFRLQEN